MYNYYHFCLVSRTCIACCCGHGHHSNAAADTQERSHGKLHGMSTPREFYTTIILKAELTHLLSMSLRQEKYEINRKSESQSVLVRVTVSLNVTILHQYSPLLLVHENRTERE